MIRISRSDFCHRGPAVMKRALSHQRGGREQVEQQRRAKRSGVHHAELPSSEPNSTSKNAAMLLDSARKLSRAVSGISYPEPVAYVYNTFDYAFAGYADYTRKYADLGRRKVLLVGMNPGPFGMAQTGVPFGDVVTVGSWLRVLDWADCPDAALPPQHPKRPLVGHTCKQVERSGERLWSLAKNRWDTPEAFFSEFWVYNYCPLAFMNDKGANVTPDKLKGAAASEVQDACDQALKEVIQVLQPRAVIGIGKFAEKCIIRCVDSDDVGVTTGSILHPSPASPAGNGLGKWEAKAAEQLQEIGISLPERRADAVSVK